MIRMEASSCQLQVTLTGWYLWKGSKLSNNVFVACSLVEVNWNITFLQYPKQADVSQHPILYTRCPTTDGSCFCSRRVSYSSHQSDSLSPCRMMSWGQMCLNYLFYIQQTPRDFPHTYHSGILRGRSGRVLLYFSSCNVSEYLHFFLLSQWSAMLRHGWTCL